SLGTAVAANVVELDDPNFTAPKRQGAYGSGGGIYGGFGPGRGLGHGPGKPGFPRNWELIFQKGGTLETYAQQLDFFKIELGVIMPDNRIVYAYNLRKAKPDKKELKPAVNEKRFYLILQNGGLAQADEDLLARAGIQTDGRPVLKFLASETEQTLARLEREYKGASPKDIRRTRFGIKGSPGAYEFFVIDQPLKR
ncbi:MAG: hypothetical protein LLG00_02105, partial [Planctomycetaceae bacterium]|nr:hypothetical protein [Planctomycetaceae bacterium]